MTKKFAKRMFTYHYRILDKYDKPVASLAILADNFVEFCPNFWETNLLGKKFIHFEFEMVKILDYKSKEQYLL